MKKSILLLLLMILICDSVMAEVGPNLTAGTDLKYYKKLRYDTARKPGYFPIWNSEPDRIKIREAYRAGNIDEVLKLADGWLKSVPIDADVHLMVAMCFKQKADIVNYIKHSNIFYGLLGSITAEGDGLSEKTAFKVVSLSEEYSVIQEIGGKVISQKLVGSCDQMEVSRKDGKTLTLYFDISEHLSALTKALK